MNVIFHLPNTKEEEQELKAKVALLYAQEIVEKLQQIPCSKEEKRELIQKLEERLCSLPSCHA